MSTIKTLLLEAPYSYEGSGKEIAGKYFPLGIGYIASHLRNAGYEVTIFQPTSEGLVLEELIGLIQTFNPDIVGISVMTPSYPGAVEICNLLKEKHKIITVLGGHHISAVGGEVLKDSPHIDFAVIGEGEETFLELVNEIKSSASSFHDIKGLAWRDTKGEAHVNPPRKPIQDIDSLAFPARDLVDMDKYKIHSYIDFGKKSATMITSRGCPFKCMFCSSHLTMGRRYRYRSTENIIAEIHELVEKYGVDHIVFEDDTITQNRERMIKICALLIEMPKRPTWYCLSRVDTMDYELAKLMKKAGCKMIAFGVESGSPEVLKAIGKKISVEKAIQAVSVCNKARLRTQCTFIVGFPSDTIKTMKLTLEAAKKINPTIAIFFPLTPYPGTEVFDKYIEPSLIPHNVEEWENFIMTDNTRGVSVNPKYSGGEIRDIANKWNRAYYLRPKHWLSMARTISGPKEFFRLLKGAIYLLRTYIRT